MALVPGLSPNIRLVPPPQEEHSPVDVIVTESGDDAPIFDDKGAVVRIEHGDGTVTVSLDGRPIEDAERKKPSGWFANLADEISDLELQRIADDLLRGIQDDERSRQQWLDDRAKGIKLLGLQIEVPGQAGADADGAPVEGQSRVRHPLLLEACLRFQAQARSELLPTDGPIKIRNDDNNADVQEDAVANALEDDANHYLTVTASEYYPDTDRMLLMLGFGGMTFKKGYFCPLRNRPVLETVDATDLIVNNSATDLKNAIRITHRSVVPKNVIRRLQLIGEYRDVALHTPDPVKLNEVDRQKAQTEGVQKGDYYRPEDRPREIYECYCYLNIVGFEHKWEGKESGLEIPYRVTIDVSSKQILCLIRNFDEPKEKDELPEAKIPIVPYTYVPGFGFYGIGLLHILGNTTNALTATWRELLDAGMYACFPGALIDKGASRQNSNILRIPPGGSAQIDTQGRPINQIVMPLPYKEPSPGLMALGQEMSQTGMRLGGTAEQAVGEGKQDAQTGAILAIIEQQTVVKDAVHKRLHAAQCEEFELLFRLFREHPKSFWQFNKTPAHPWDEKTFLDALENYELVPQADPNTSGQTQRVLKYMGLAQRAAMMPQIYNPLAVEEALLRDVLKIANPQQFFNPPQAMARPTPDMIEKQAKAKETEARAQATLMTAKARQDEVKAKTMQMMVSEARESRTAGLDPGAGGGKPPKTPHEMSIEAMKAEATLMDAHTRAKQADMKKGEILLNDANDQENRQSQQKLEILKMAKDAMDKRADMQIQQSEHQDAMRMDMHKHQTEMGARQAEHAADLEHQHATHSADLEHQAEMKKGELKSRETISKRQAKKNAAPKP